MDQKAVNTLKNNKKIDSAFIVVKKYIDIFGTSKMVKKKKLLNG